MKIRLHYRRKDFEEIYAAQISFRKAVTRRENAPLVQLVAMLLLLFVTGLLYTCFTGKFTIAPVIALVILGIVVLALIPAIIKMIRQKIVVGKYLDSLEKYDDYHLTIDENKLTVRYSKGEYTEKWENIRSVILTEDYILLSHTGGHLLYPKKSMEPWEFEQLTNCIKIYTNNDPLI